MGRRFKTDMRAFLSTWFVLVSTPLLSGQTATLTLPVTATGFDANGSTTYPSGEDDHVRAIFVYPTTNFAGLDHLIRVVELKFRADAGAVTQGGTVLSARIDMSTARQPANSMSTNFEMNHGPDRTMCFFGPVAVQPTTGGSPNDHLIHVDLTTPFVFDPTSGDDLAIEFVRVANYTGDTNGRLHDAVVDGSGGRRLSGSLAAISGTLDDEVPVVTLVYETQVAFANTIGSGCGKGSGSTFYEQFHPRHNPFDLADSGWTGYLAEPSYVVIAGASPIVAPGSPDLAFADDEVRQVSLPWAMPTPHGVTSDVWVCSNGFVALEPTANADAQATMTKLLEGPCRICPAWSPLNPAHAGSVHAEIDPNDPSLFHITWLNVAEYRNAVTVSGSNTFQLTLSSGGNFETKYGSISLDRAFVGFTRGHGALQNETVDIDVDTPQGWLPGYDNRPLELTFPIGQSPRFGTSFTITLREIPPTAQHGALLFSFDELDPAVDLTPIGMPGCTLLLDNILAPKPLTLNGTPTSSIALAIPTDPGLAGLSIYCQTAAAGMTNVWPLQVGLSNALRLVIDAN